MDSPPEPDLGARFGFRRRCGWCGVVLRGWQLNLCRFCKTAASVEWLGAPCVHASRWEDEPDAWFWTRSTIRGRWLAWKLAWKWKNRARDLDA